MQRRKFITLIGGAAVAWPLVARAQQKTTSIGFLAAGAAETSAPLIEAVKQGLRENGLVEGKDYVLEPRWAEGHYERFPAFARELAERAERYSAYMRMPGFGGNRGTMRIQSGPRDLLVKALGMLGSDHAGERVNAGLVVEKQRTKLGMTWDVLIHV
jgi:hypothetical protein